MGGVGPPPPQYCPARLRTAGRNCVLARLPMRCPCSLAAGEGPARKQPAMTQPCQVAGRSPCGHLHGSSVQRSGGTHQQENCRDAGHPVAPGRLLARRRRDGDDHVPALRACAGRRLCINRASLALRLPRVVSADRAPKRALSTSRCTSRKYSPRLASAASLAGPQTEPEERVAGRLPLPKRGGVGAGAW